MGGGVEGWKSGRVPDSCQSGQLSVRTVVHQFAPHTPREAVKSKGTPPPHRSHLYTPTTPMSDIISMLQKHSDIPKTKDFTFLFSDIRYKVSTFGLIPVNDAVIEEFFEEGPTDMHIVIQTKENAGTFTIMRDLLLEHCRQDTVKCPEEIGWIARFKQHVAMGSLNDTHPDIRKTLRNLCTVVA